MTKIKALAGVFIKKERNTYHVVPLGDQAFGGPLHAETLELPQELQYPWCSHGETLSPLLQTP